MFRDYVKQDPTKHKNVVIASFNPWLYEDTAALITSFFATIAAELKSSDSNVLKTVGKTFKGIGKFLTAASTGVTFGGISVDADKIAKHLQGAGELSSGLAGLAELADKGEKKLEQHRTTVEKALKRLGEKNGRVVILIDDVDRLSKGELLTMLRLIRTVADLPFTTLIIAMDDERVRDILGQAVSDGYGKGFLDKIIQIPLHIPLPESSMMTKELVTQITTTLEERGLPIPQELSFTQHYQPQALRILLSLIRTPRDLVRYINGLRTLLLAGTNPDVHPTDAALIEALRIFYPDVYARVRRSKDFLIPRSSSLVSALAARIGENRDEERKRRSAELDLLVRGSVSNLEPTAEEPIRTLLSLLFGNLTNPVADNNYDERAAPMRRISAPEFFDNYFRYAPPAGTVTSQEIESIFSMLVDATNLEERETRISAILINTLRDREESVRDRIIEDLGYRLKSVSAEVLEQIGMGVLAAASQLSVENVSKLLTCVFTVATDARKVIDNVEAEIAASALSYRLLQAALASKRLVTTALYELLKHSRRNWLSKEHSVEFSKEFLQHINAELRAGNLLKGPDPHEITYTLQIARELIDFLGDSSPVKLNDFQTHLTEHINHHPNRLPLALYQAAIVRNNIPILLHSQRTLEQTREVIRNVFGEYERLRPAFETLRRGKSGIVEYRQLLEDFGKVLDEPIRHTT
jgi:hypothetical protein